jgi:nitrogen fixation protein NifU and related proteins
MSALRELYQQVILDHNRKPRNFRVLPAANRTAHGDNPLCGDRITLYLDVADGVIRDAGFQGSGCAISRAAASMMTASVKGKTEDEVHGLFDRLHRVLTGDERAATTAEEDLGKLAVFAGVREFPSRVKCATLPWHTLNAALAGKAVTVSTEETGE